MRAASHSFGLLFGLMALVAPAPAGAQGSPVAPRDIRLGLFGTCMVNPTVGWVVGDLGRVFKTTDGGKTWQRQDVSGRRPFFSASCLDANTAWLSSTEGKIFATSDGGASWKEQQTPVKRNLFKVVFVTPQRGTAVGDFGIIVHTEDGGATWTELGLPADFKLPEVAEEQGVLPNDALLYGLTFADENNGWLSGEWGTILRTEDGGRTWKQQTSGVESTLFGIGFSDASNGIAVGMDSVTLHTEDGGRTWTPVKTPFQERSYYEVALSGRTAWIAGNQGTLLVSSDGGRTWKDFPTPKEIWSEWFRGIALVGDSGFVVGGAGKIYATKGSDAVLLNPSASAAHEG
jgi:photosystem II stability/assembly factor-like uncharacterized protein